MSMTLSLKIYGIPQSRAARALWMARELGVPHENVPVHFTKTRESAELVRLNPNARIPTIDDGGFPLYESMAINLYLVKKYGAGTKLAFTSLEQEAQATQWSFWVMTEVERPVLGLLLHTFGMRPADEATLVQYRADLERPFKVLDDHLASQPYLLGSEFSAADLNVASVLAWALTAKMDLSAWPRLADWLTRCTSRPAYKG